MFTIAPYIVKSKIPVPYDRMTDEVETLRLNGVVMSNYTDVSYTGDKNTTWFKMFNNIPERSCVLDVGCSSGNFGEVLIKGKSCEVVGVDLDKEDVNRAKKLLKDAYVMNIESDDFSKLGKFDRIIFADVLEHLQNPVASLMKVKKLL